MVRQSRLPDDSVLVLVTRPAADAARFAAMLVQARRGTCILTSPLLAPSLLPVHVPSGGLGGLVLTSGTALEVVAGLELPPGLPAFCVGPRTAERAAALGLAAQNAGGDAEALLALILRLRPQGPLWHLHGAETRGNLSERLNSAGIETISTVCYRQEARPLSPVAVQALVRPGRIVLPVFSPRSAQLLLAALAPLDLRATLEFVAISEASAAPLHAAGLGAITVADRPDGPAMRDCVLRLLDRAESG